jgi:hypothetical protein
VKPYVTVSHRGAGIRCAHAPNSRRKRYYERERERERERLDCRLWKYGVLGPLEGHKLAIEIPWAGVQWETATVQWRNSRIGQDAKNAVIDWPHQWTRLDCVDNFRSFCRVHARIFDLPFSPIHTVCTDWLPKPHILELDDTERSIKSCYSLLE